MEYDRALYRIYDRLLDDLGGSESIFGHEPNTDDSTVSVRGQNDRVIPFLLPISFLRCYNKFDRNILKRKIRGFFNFRLLQQYFQDSIWSLSTRSSSQRSHYNDEDELQTLSSAASVELTSVADSRIRDTGLRRRIHSVSVQFNESSADNNNPDLEANTLIEVLSEQNSVSQDETRRRRQQQQNDHVSAGCNQRFMYIFMHLNIWFAFLHLLILSTLHYTYVGPRISKRFQNVKDRRRMSSTISFRETCIESALSTRPEAERSKFYTMAEEQKIIANDQDMFFPLNKNDMQFVANSTAGNDPAPLLGRNEILQINILYGKRYDGRGCSRVRKVQPSKAKTNETDSMNMWKIWSHLWPLFQEDENDTIITSDCSSTDSHFTSEKFWEKPHYKFSTNEALMFLDDNMLKYHNISVVNVTLTEQCLSTGDDHGSNSIMSSVSEFLSRIYGMDTVIMNQVMYGIRTSEDDFRNGYLHNLETNERWSYSQKQVKYDYERRHSIIKWLMNRVGVLVVSVLAFSLVTTLTALVIRVLTTSGVTIFFPVFACFQRWGVPGLDDRLLEYSYPWIGVPRSVIRRQGIYPVKNFLWAHLGKLFLVYTIYESCQYGFSSFLYGKSIPQNLPVWTFGFAMVLEYFSMIFVRSAVSALFFPRMVLIYFIGYHLYFYSVPYGWFHVAAMIWISLTIHSMVFVVLALEVPASKRGAVSMDHPREVYSKLGWSEWSTAIPNEWTLFLPLNARYIPMHDRIPFENETTRQHDAAVIESVEVTQSSSE